MCDFFAGECHRHTALGSKRDGFGSVEAGVAYGAQLGYKALAVTDHGMMSAVPEHYKACKKYGIKPIIGVEAYFQVNYDPHKDAPYYHMSLLAKNNTGYENLCKMLTYAGEHQPRWQKGRDVSAHGWIPILTLDDLTENHEGIIQMSGCIGGIIPQMILENRLDDARALLDYFYELFGKDYYLELMPHSIKDDGVFDKQRAVNEQLLSWQKRYSGLRAVGTTDSHMVQPEDYPTYMKMWEISKAKPSTDYSRLHLHSGESWAKNFKSMMGIGGEQYLETTFEIMEKCDVSLEFTDMKPKVEWGEPSDDRLLRLTFEGLEEKGLWDWDGTEAGWTKSQYVREAMREYNIVLKTGFTDYFLIVQDYLEFAKKRGIHYAARGSVNGFLLAYVLGISQVDSIKHGTYPFRFLREDKVDVDPDIDMDMDPAGRQEVFAYLFEKYAGRSAPISNFSFWSTKALINELLKTYPQMSATDKVKVKDALVAIDYDEKPIGFKLLFENEVFGEFFREFEQRNPGVLLHFCNLHGQLQHYGRHAGGVIITNEEAWKYVSMFRTAKEGDEQSYALQTAYNMEGLSELRLMKYDVLGVKEHQHIAEIEKMVGCTFDDAIIHDERLYAWFRDIRTEAVFQSGSSLAQKMYQGINVQNFSEVCVAISMNRPGPYSSGLFKKYVEGKAGNVDMSMPWYRICAETYGAIVYQEHAMLICVELAGMSWPHADKFVKGISKKKISDELKQEFIDGLGRVSGITPDVAEHLCDAISKYSFNKNHAVGYALIAVYGMWLKVNYPFEFYCTALRKKSKSKKEIEGLEMLEAAFLRDTRNADDPSDPDINGYILPPHINGPANYDIVTRDGNRFLQQGLTNIDGVGPKAAEDIASHGPYQEPDFAAYGAVLREKTPDITDEEIIIKTWQKTLKDAGVAGRNASEKIVRALKSAGALQMNEDIIFDIADAYRSRLIRQHEWKWKKAQQIAKKNQQKEMEAKQKWARLHEQSKEAI